MSSKTHEQNGVHQTIEAFNLLLQQYAFDTASFLLENLSGRPPSAPPKAKALSRIVAMSNQCVGEFPSHLQGQVVAAVFDIQEWAIEGRAMMFIVDELGLPLENVSDFINTVKTFRVAKKVSEESIEGWLVRQPSLSHKLNLCLTAVGPESTGSESKKHGRLKSEQSESMRAQMLGLLRQYPAMKDSPRKLAGEIGVSRSTASRWLNALEREYLESRPARPAKRNGESEE